MKVKRVERKINKKLTKKQKAELKKKKLAEKKKKLKKKKHTQIVVRKKQDKYSSSMTTLVASAESQLSLQEIQGQIVDKLAYSFKDKKKNMKVDGLTFWGLEACTKYDKRNKWSPVWTEPKYQPLFESKILLTIGCINPKTKKTEFGNCIFDANIRYSERTALTNAKRYALDKHISIPQKIAFVQFLLKHKPKQVLKVDETSKSKSEAGFTVSDTGKVKSKEGGTINL